MERDNFDWNAYLESWDEQVSDAWTEEGNHILRDILTENEGLQSPLLSQEVQIDSPTVNQPLSTPPPPSNSEPTSNPATVHQPLLCHSGSSSGLMMQLYFSGQPSTIKAEEPPLALKEESVNIDSLSSREEDSQSPGKWVAAPPQLTQSLCPWNGQLKFRASIPFPNMEGVKPKWSYSGVLDKLYVAKNVDFPVCITLETYPPGLSLVLCPVFTKEENRMKPVFRCPNCLLSDPNPLAKEHVIQVESHQAAYLIQDHKRIVSLPLGFPAPGDTSINIFMRVACNTSCVGGPNRRLFCILLALCFMDREIGRQVINVKCCEGVDRDRQKDEETHTASSSPSQLRPHQPQQVQQQRSHSHRQEQRNEDLETTIRIANEIATNDAARRVVASKRKKNNKASTTISLGEGQQTIVIPQKFIKKVKKYVNFLYMKEQLLSENKKLKMYYPSETESE